MKASDILLGAAVIAVGVVIYRAMQPPPPAPTPISPSSSSAGGILGGVLGGLIGVGAERLGEAVRGERDWW